jgi:hypothetical protein
MSEFILPPTLAVLPLAFTPCFQARSVVVFQWLVLGGIQCQGRRTLTGVALASGAVGERHLSVFHRFFSRASWTLDALGRVVFTLAVTWLPADQPLVVLGDDTLASRICCRRSARNCGRPAFLSHRSHSGAPKIRLQFATTLSRSPHNGGSRA